MAIEREAEVVAALKDLQKRCKGYSLHADYFDGKHRMAFATDKFKKAFGELFKEFADNLCPAPVAAVTDKLELTGFKVAGGDASLADEAWEIWEENRMGQRAGEAHEEALVSGDCYLVVWPGEDGRPTIHPNEGKLMAVVYDQEKPGKITLAVKQWKVGKETRLNIYYPDRIEKYISVGNSAGSGAGSLTIGGKAYQQYKVEDEPWPAPNPYGQVPVFHLANNAKLGAFGRSELRDVVPVQDALNKALADMLVAMEFVAFPQRWAVGVEEGEYDEETGKPKEQFTAGVDRVWMVAESEAKFGEFSQANLEQFLKVQDSFRVEIARLTATPLHYMAMLTDPPSGEALKTLDARSTKKVENRSGSFGNTWEDALAFALLIAGRAGAKLQAQWKDPAPKSQKEHVETLALKKEKLEVPIEQIWKEADYPEATVEEWAKKREEEKASLRSDMPPPAPAVPAVPAVPADDPTSPTTPTARPPVKLPVGNQVRKAA